MPPQNVLFAHGLGDGPGTLQAFGEGHEVFGADGHGLARCRGDRGVALEDVAHFFFVVGPGERGGFLGPDGPFLDV